MADAKALAAFVGISRDRIPPAPEQLPDPKRALVNLARRSRHRAVKQDMVPREGSGRAVGPAYGSRLTEFVENDWRPDVASERAESLRRAMACLQRLSLRRST